MCGVQRHGVLVIGLLAHLLNGQAHAQTSDRPPTFDTTDLQADLAFLQQQLVSRHPAPFMYCQQEELAHHFDSLRVSITEPMNALRFLAHINSLHPLLGDGHTMFLPPDDDAPKGYLPIDVACTGDRLHVRGNGSSDPRVVPGTEILSINGVPAATIIDTLMMRQIRDGNNTTYPIWILDHWFRQYYRFSFGEPHHFDLVLASPHGEERVALDALPTDSINVNIARNTPPHPRAVPDFGLRYMQGDSTAILTIPTFEKGEVSGRMIDEVFAELRTRKVRRLVLDLRGNQGGDPRSAKRLLAHLLMTEFELVHKGPAAGTTKPLPEPYNGQLAVLMNGGSFSVTGMVLSCLERQRSASFIGEEAGGNRTVLSGSPKHVRLPGTRINCYISTRLWQLVDRPNDGHGVQPTITASPTIDDIIQGRDPAMAAALRVLRGR